MLKTLALVGLMACSAAKAETPPEPQKTISVAVLLQEYEQAKAQDNTLDACIRAGLIAIAYLKIGDTSNWDHWRKVEIVYCKRAGLM